MPKASFIFIVLHTYPGFSPAVLESTVAIYAGDIGNCDKASPQNSKQLSNLPPGFRVIRVGAYWCCGSRGLRVTASSIVLG